MTQVTKGGIGRRSHEKWDGRRVIIVHGIGSKTMVIRGDGGCVSINSGV